MKLGFKADDALVTENGVINVEASAEKFASLLTAELGSDEDIREAILAAYADPRFVKGVGLDMGTIQHIAYESLGLTDHSQMNKKKDAIANFVRKNSSNRRQDGMLLTSPARGRSGGVRLWKDVSPEEEAKLSAAVSKAAEKAATKTE